MTILEVLNAASGYLQKQGVESPRLNAELLLAHTLKRKRLELYLEFDRPLSDAERAPLRELIRERGAGRPLQHLIGSVEFLGRPFRTDARALIPRPETEELCTLCLARSFPEAARVLDVGTGSGVLAVTLALEHPDAIVHAVDVSSQALALAAENSATLGAAVTFHEADLWPPGEAAFDLIVANLPYIPTAEIPTLAREVRHDPVTALDGGPDGLEVLTRLITEAPARLARGGSLAMEIGHDQAGRTADLLAANNYRDITQHRDYQNVERFIIASYG